jgi:Tfp pilus assembly protein PilF
MMLTLTVLLLCQPGAAQEPPKRRPKLDAAYAHPFYAFKIHLPPKWARGPNHGKAHLSFYGPRDGAFIPRIDMFVERDSTTLADLAAKYRNAFAKAYPEATFDREEATAVRDREGYQFAVSFMDDPVEMKSLWTFTATDDRKYILSFNCSKALYDRHEPPVNAAMKSLRLFPEPASSTEEKQKFLDHYNKGYEYHRSGKTEAAITSFQEAAKLLPGFADIHGVLAMLYKLKGRFTDAEKSYRKSIELDPGDFDSQFSLGALLLQQNKADEALAFLTRAAELEPDREVAQTNLAVAWLAKDQPEKAKPCLEKAIALDPESVAAHYNFGMCLEKLSDPKGAERQYKDALQIDPAHKGAKEGLARLRSKK